MVSAKYYSDIFRGDWAPQGPLPQISLHEDLTFLFSNLPLFSESAPEEFNQQGWKQWWGFLFLATTLIPPLISAVATFVCRKDLFLPILSLALR